MDASSIALTYDALASAVTINDATTSLRRFTKAAEHEHFICEFFSRGTRVFAPFAIHNYPRTWLERAARVPQALYARDPVFEHIDSSPLPFLWTRSDYETAGAAEVWEESSAAGIGTGIAVSVECSRSIVLRMGLSRDSQRAASDAEAVQLKAHLMLFAMSLKARAADLIIPEIRKSMPKLTGRELDALKWTREGKTAYELGAILGISYGTANFHLQNAQRKLASTDKHQAVLRALEWQLID